jgi:hypothetical protein
MGYAENDREGPAALREGLGRLQPLDAKEAQILWSLGLASVHAHMHPPPDRLFVHQMGDGFVNTVA